MQIALSISASVLMFPNQTPPRVPSISAIAGKWSSGLSRAQTPLNHQHLVAILDAVLRLPEHSIQVFM